MMNKHSILVFVVLLVLSMICCDDERTVVSPSAKIYGSDYYPLNIGNYWSYEIDGLGQGNVLITTTDTIRHIDGNLLYIYKQDNLTDSCTYKYYANRNEGIYYYTGAADTSEDCFGNRYPTVKRNILKAELRDNDEWLTYNFPTSIPDTFSVFTGYEIIAVRGIFQDCILVTRCSSYAIDSLFYARNIGLVRGVYHTRDGLPSTILNIDEFFVQQTSTSDNTSIRAASRGKVWAPSALH